MQYLRTLKYGFHVIFHPFDGFWDLKKERRGSVAASLTFVALTIFMLVVQKQNTAFLFNKNRLETIDVMVDIISVGLMCILWCISNWCLTSLMDGEGKMKDILIATGYALLPIILIRLPMVVMSLAITAEEGTFYYVLDTVSYLWAGALVFFGTMVTHQYSLKKTVLTCLCTILGMAIILFIGLLFFNVIQQMLTFIITVYKEIRF